MTEQEQKEAMQQINQKTEAAMALIREAQALADKANVTFDFSLAYGMGGTYFPKLTDEQKEQAKKEAEEKGRWYDSYENEGWQSSSSRC